MSAATEAPAAGTRGRGRVAVTPPRHRLRRLGKALALPAVLVLLWATVSQTDWIRPLFLPSPQELWDAFLGLAPTLPRAIAATLSMTLSGFALGALAGSAIGLVMAYSSKVREFVGPLFDFVRPVPIFALIPLFVLWFGIGRAPQVLLVALGCAVILVVTTLEAVRNVPPIYVAAAMTLGASRRRIYRTVVLPWLVPHIIGAIRVAATLAWGLGVAAEFMGSQQGLGYLIILQQTYLRTAGIILIVLIYSLLAVGVDWLIASLERRVTQWSARHGAKGPASAFSE